MDSTVTPFDLIGGAPCLDFTNTLAGARPSRTRELLTSYADLVRWARESELVSAQEAAALLERAALEPEQAQAVLRRARILREALYEILSAEREGREPAATDLEALNAELVRAMSVSRVRRSRDGYCWDSADGNDLDRPLHPVARSAADLLLSPDRAYLGVCNSSRCTWLYVDTSKNRRRRWCEMKSCGNREKARRFRERRG